MSRTSPSYPAVLVAIALFCTAFLAADERPPTAEERFQAAWYHELAESRFEDALAAYRALVADAKVPKPLRARALYRSATCLGKLQRADESRQALERVLADFADVTDVADAARAEIAGETEEQALFRMKVESLIARLRDDSADVRTATVDRLRSIGPKSARYLLPLLGSGDYFTTIHAGELLVDFADEDPSVVSAVLGALRGGDEIVRVSLTTELGKSKARAWPPVLRGLLTDRSAQIRAAAATALGNVEDREAIDGLVGLVKDADPAVRIAAIEALGEFADHQRFLPVFEASYSDSDERVRYAAVREVKNLKGAVDITIPLTAHLLDDESRRVVASALSLLSRHVQSARQAGRAAPVRDFWPEGEAGNAALAAIARLTGHADAVMRYEATRILALSGRKEAVATLRHLLDDGEDKVVQEALNGLGSLASRDVIPDIVALLASGASSGRKTRAWTMLTRTFQGADTLEELSRRLPELGDLADDAIGLFSSAERDDLVAAAFERHARIDAAGRQKLLALLDPGRSGRRTVVRGRSMSRMPSRSRTVPSRFAGLPRGLPLVLASLEASDTALVASALAAATGYDDERVTTKVTRLLDSAESLIRIEAIDTLRAYESPRCLAPVVERLADRDARIADRAQRALTDNAPPDVVPRAIEILADRETLYPKEALAVVEQLVQPSHVPAIADVVASVKPSLRIGLLKVLGRFPDPAVTSAAIAQLEAEDPRLRAAAVRCLGATGSENATDVDQRVAALAGALDDPESRVCAAAAEALGRRDIGALERHPDVLDRLAAKLDHDGGSGEAPVSTAALKALIAIGGEPGRAACLHVLDFPGSAFRQRAVKELGERRDPRDLPRLLERFAAERKFERNENALELLIDAFRAYGDPRALAPLCEALLEENFPKSGSTRIVWSLSHYPSAAAIDVVERMITDERWKSYRTKAVEELGDIDDPRARALLIRQLGSSDNLVRRAAVGVVGETFDRALLPKLAELLRDSDEEVRKVARASIDAYRFYLETTRLIDDAPQAADRSALDELLRLLTHDDAAVRRAAAESLGRLKDPRALPALVRQRKDDDASVRQAVDAALDALSAR